jgi:acetyltransferase-like isoleucine patch superfamily enzyme
VHVGQRCLIASETIFMTSDMHSIFDQQTGQRINPARSIVLGDDVWLGAEAAVMKGAKIGAGSAVGFRSIVTGEIPPGCVAAGTPARVLRESVRWRHELI